VLTPADIVDPEDVRPEAVHVRGVDNLSTEDVTGYVKQLFPEDFKIEWIDDTSLNVVYLSAEIATSAIQALSSDYIESLPLTTLRPAKSVTDPKSIDGIKIRIATLGDKKEKGARDRSRWYLFNPHPLEEYDRRYFFSLISHGFVC
jgi:Nuclear cap-binding protein subunit 3